jgi:hypothetical protein
MIDVLRNRSEIYGLRHVVLSFLATKTRKHKHTKSQKCRIFVITQVRILLAKKENDDEIRQNTTHKNYVRIFSHFFMNYFHFFNETCMYCKSASSINITIFVFAETAQDQLKWQRSNL